MTKDGLFITGFGIVSVLAISLVYFTNQGCNWVGGHWASASSFCYTKLCYHFGDCGGPWVQPALQCSSVKVGEPEAMVYFYFGNPQHRDGSHVKWTFGKPEARIIEATIINERLVALECPR